MGEYLGDLKKTEIIDELFKIPREQRDEEWTKKFLENVGDASFRCGDPQTILGPDSFPYFSLYLPEPYKEFQCYVLQHMKDDFLLEKGLGVVFNSNGGSADWVFTYGDIVNYFLNGKFYTPELNPPEAPEEKSPMNILVGQPSETYLPKAVRNVLKNYLVSVGISVPQVFLSTRKSGDSMMQELVFDFTPDMFASPDAFESVMNRIAWFLPRHYSYATSPKTASFGASFMPL